VVWLASGTAAAQQGAAPDAAKPAVEVLPPADPAAAEAAARQKEEEEAAAKERAALRADVEALRQEVASERAARTAAEQAVGAQVETLNAKAKETPPTVGTARVGLGLTGFIQSDFALRLSSTDQLNSSSMPLNEDRFMIRRARLRATLDRWWVAGALELDGNTVNGPTARLIGAEASLKWPPERGNPVPLLMGTIGLFKIPFGFEVVQSDRERLFMERSTAERALFPGEYDVGVRLQGGWQFVRYAIAVQNGEPIGEKGFSLRDPNQAKDVTGRIGVETPLTPSVFVAAGFSGLSGKGFHPGTPATKATLQWNDRNGDGSLMTSEIVAIPGMAASPSANFTRFAYGGDLRLGVNIPGVGQTVAYGEVYWAKNLDRAILPADPVSFARDYRELGVYAALTQEVGSNAQFGFRWDFYNPDADSVNQVMGAMLPTALSYTTFAFAAALKASSGRLIAELDINRNHNGRDTLGNPTNLKDNAFIVRGEASF
jgi:hypothetical protein